MSAVPPSVLVVIRHNWWVSYASILEGAALTAFVVEVLAVLVVLGLRRITSRKIIPHLQSATDRQVSRRVRFRGWVWTPFSDGYFKSGRYLWLPGNAVATYRWDSDGSVGLHYVTDAGRATDYSGPFPARFVSGSSASRSASRSRKVLVGLLASYIGCAAAGFVIGYALWPAPRSGVRLGDGVVGVLVGVFAGYVLMHFAVIVFGVRRGMHRDSSLRTDTRPG